MDARRHASLFRLLSSRRQIGHALTALPMTAGIAALSSFGTSEAKKKRKKKKKCPKLPLPPFCAGKNVCFNVDATCQRSGDVCGCLVAAPTAAPFCGRSADAAPVNSCLDCPEGRTCVFAAGGHCGTSNFLCVSSCPDPL